MGIVNTGYQVLEVFDPDDWNENQNQKEDDKGNETIKLSQDFL